MAEPHSNIDRILGRVRGRIGLVALSSTLGWGFSVSLASLLAGAVGLTYGPARIASPLRQASLALATLALIAALAWVAWRLLAGGGLEQAARAAAHEDPMLRSAILSSVELARERETLERTGSSSVALVDEHVRWTAERLRALDLAKCIPFRPARRAGLVLATVSTLQLVAVLVFGPSLLRGYSRLVSAGRSPVATFRLEPITGDIELTYIYPAYMKRSEKKVGGTSGDVTAPRGTEVRIVTRSDRPVTEAQIVVESFRTVPSISRSHEAGPTSAMAEPASREAPSAPPGPLRQRYALRVGDARDLSGSFVIDEGGSYRFQFLKHGEVKVSGPPIPVVVEPDAFPEVRITAPAAQVEVDAAASVRVEWSASDDFGLSELALVLKPPGAVEERRTIRTFDSTRREAGSFELDLRPLRLAEGEKLLYWLEVKDNDAISGPKRAASSTQVVKIYSEAEHHRQSLEQARHLWEEMVRLLGDRLEQLPHGALADPEQLARGEALDDRTRQLHEHLREASISLRKDRSAPKEIPVALSNVASTIRLEEERLTALRQSLLRWIRAGHVNASQTRRLEELDEGLNRELEKDVLYLEQLFDKGTAEDLVRMGRDLASRRRELASLLEKYKTAPTEQAKQQLIAEIARLKARMEDMLRQMSQLARGSSEEHVNAEAMEELVKSKDLAGSMTRIKDLLDKGDVDQAMKELDAMGSTLDGVLSSLEQAAGLPDVQNASLMKQLMDFKRNLESVSKDQEKLAGETGKVRAQYRKAVVDRLKKVSETTRRLEELAKKAQDELRQSHPGTSARSEDDYTQAKERLEDLRRALAARDLDAALDVSKRALPPLQRLAGDLESEALMAEHYAGFARRDAKDVREAAIHAKEAIPPARKVREELEAIFPDPATVLPRSEQQRLDKLAKEERGLEERAGKLQQQLEQLMQAAPIFPPQASQTLGEGRGHMQAAADELGKKNPQRGHGQQREALDALGRLEEGLKHMARSRGGGGFPFPLAEARVPRGEGEGEPSRETVEIPQADPTKGEQFRKDLLEAMKQETPEPYRGEVKRYYEELVK